MFCGDTNPSIPQTPFLILLLFEMQNGILFQYKICVFRFRFHVLHYLNGNANKCCIINARKTYKTFKQIRRSFVQ